MVTAVAPPSTGSTTPAMNSEASLAKNTAAQPADRIESGEAPGEEFLKLL
jgi:hypothetical protein